MKILITGGAGFIGCNTAKRFLDAGNEVVILDNLSRKGSESNLEWLNKQSSFEFIMGDIRNEDTMREVISDKNSFNVIIHLAAQVAVTSSVLNPREDFEINMIGTFNLLEAIRNTAEPPILLYASTNKVYGELQNASIQESKVRYEFQDIRKGIPEDYPLDFHSPYGCSKGGADQYVHDYARIYEIPTVVLRQSCIYGFRQFGVEDQGWIAWFIIASQLGMPITIYGDGKQVRDILFIDDLIDVFEAVIEYIDLCRNQVFNIGGGPNNQISVLELLDEIKELSGSLPRITFTDWRPGDQLVYVSNIEKSKSSFGWIPKVDNKTGIAKLYSWVAENIQLFEKQL